MAAAGKAREEVSAGAIEFSRGMASYYAGDSLAAVESLARWHASARGAPALWRQSAARVLVALAASVEFSDANLGKRAQALAGELSGRRSR